MTKQYSPRERVLRALAFETVDIPPVDCVMSPAGLYEHGTKLRDWMAACGSDFGDPSAFATHSGYAALAELVTAISL